MLLRMLLVLFLGVAGCSSTVVLPTTDSDAGVRKFNPRRIRLMASEDRKWLFTVIESCAWSKSSSSYRVSGFVVEFVEPDGSEIDLHLRGSEIYLVSESGLYVCEVSSEVASRITAIGA